MPSEPRLAGIVARAIKLTCHQGNELCLCEPTSQELQRISQASHPIDVVTDVFASRQAVVHRDSKDLHKLL